MSDSYNPIDCVAFQASLSRGFPRQEYWSGLPFAPPGDLPNPGIEPMSPGSPGFLAGSVPLSHWGSPFEKWYMLLKMFYNCEVYYTYRRMCKCGCYSSVQFNSVAQSCPTLCYPMDCSTPSFPVHHQLPEFTQTNVH